MNTSTTQDNHATERNGEIDDAEPRERGFEQRKTWLRLFYMLVVVFLYSVSRVVTAAVIVLQFFWVLFTAEPNDRLTEFGQSLATYSYQIVRFLTYNSEDKPFPFSRGWPSGPPQ